MTLPAEVNGLSIFLKTTSENSVFPWTTHLCNYLKRIKMTSQLSQKMFSATQVSSLQLRIKGIIFTVSIQLFKMPF